MKKVLIAAAFAGLMLSACSSSKTEKAPEANLTVEQAMQECQQTLGGTQDRAAFDACMKDKGFERPAADAGAAAPAVPAPTK
ncbi:Uncharacterised protein [Neisseria animaloris]|uniref:hypothetical protein n=1 Tax=Neisseria animaloris TaxID=326522 RepID=UPI000A195926|nr:hypothetical protein [Neisseria animaloris]OSI07067.1 hypothetical protein BWD08_09340 [Neisseria animaloris]VEH88202.1 Uncharacterised protein [Neisseria animaloris]